MSNSDITEIVRTPERLAQEILERQAALREKEAQNARVREAHEAAQRHAAETHFAPTRKVFEGLAKLHMTHGPKRQPVEITVGPIQGVIRSRGMGDWLFTAWAEPHPGPPKVSYRHPKMTSQITSPAELPERVMEWVVANCTILEDPEP